MQTHYTSLYLFLKYFEASYLALFQLLQENYVSKFRRSFAIAVAVPNMVTCYHNCLNSCMFTSSYRIFYTFSWWVYHSELIRTKIKLFSIVSVSILLGKLSTSKYAHAKTLKALSAILEFLFKIISLSIFSKFLTFPLFIYLSASPNKYICRTFCYNSIFISIFMYCSHKLSI